MNSHCHKLLARSSLTGDEYTGINLSKFGHRSFDFLKGFTLTDKGNTQLFHFWIRGGGSSKQFSSENLRRKIFGQALEQSMAGYAFRMIIHFAYPVSNSNAQVVEGSTATWEIPIWDLQQEDSFTMEATLKVKESWWEKIRAIF